jgi:hypothetical protein
VAYAIVFTRSGANELLRLPKATRRQFDTCSASSRGHLSGRFRAHSMFTRSKEGTVYGRCA